jgi:ATP cone domain-containing protein
MKKKSKNSKSKILPGVRKKTASKMKPAKIMIRRSSGRKEMFDMDRMAQTAGRSGVPFLMARTAAKKVAKKIKTESKGRTNKTVTARRVTRMIAKELRDGNQQTIAKAYLGIAPENMPKEPIDDLPKPHIGDAGRDKHTAYRADRDSVLHDKSKRQWTP